MTSAEAFYYLKQMNGKTPMVVVLSDGEELRGVIEWYDRNAIKVNRVGAPNLLVMKSSVKYMYKAEELLGSQQDGRASRTRTASSNSPPARQTIVWRMMSSIAAWMRRFAATTFPLLRYPSRPRKSVVTPPASRTIRAPAAISQAERDISQNPSNRPQAVVAEVERGRSRPPDACGLQDERLERAQVLFQARLRPERNPVASSAPLRESRSVMRIRCRLRKAPPPAMAWNISSRVGS